MVDAFSDSLLMKQLLMSRKLDAILMVFHSSDMTKANPFLVAATFVAFLTMYSPFASAQEAPFGFHWGDRLASLPKATKILREKNITALLYKRENVPAVFPDTEEITLKVCDAEGLQQILWVSRLLSGEDARRQFASTYAEGVRRYGEAEEGDPGNGTASWSKARVTMFAKLAEPGFYRIFMIQDGPAFQACAKTHDTGGPMPNRQLE
jgi:hypothetical protein